MTLKPLIFWLLLPQEMMVIIIVMVKIATKILLMLAIQSLLSRRFLLIIPIWRDMFWQLVLLTMQEELLISVIFVVLQKIIVLWLRVLILPVPTQLQFFLPAMQLVMELRKPH